MSSSKVHVIMGKEVCIMLDRDGQGRRKAADDRDLGKISGLRRYWRSHDQLQKLVALFLYCKQPSINVLYAVQAARAAARMTWQRRWRQLPSSWRLPSAQPRCAAQFLTPSPPHPFFYMQF